MNGEPIRIANCSGYYGDRPSAALEMVTGGEIDVLTGDYLAELTMFLLWKARQRDEDAGYARTFLAQLEEVLGTCLDRGIRIVVNAGGLNPGGLAREVRALAARLGLRPSIAHLEGDDVLACVRQRMAQGDGIDHADTGRSLAAAGIAPVTANAYLGGWGIVAALQGGADVVVCPRVADASLVVGPAAWHFGWPGDGCDPLAGAVVAGHLVECGPQVTGGNLSFSTRDRADHRLPGFPLVEVFDDGSCVITKHPGTGGGVTTDTVTAQLVYEIQGADYVNPDVTALLDGVTVRPDGPDRVRVQGARGRASPRDVKVGLNYPGGYRNSVTFVLTGLDIDAKRDHVLAQLFATTGGRDQYDEVHERTMACEIEGATPSRVTLLEVTVMSTDAERVGRRFSDAAAQLALSSYAGFHTLAPPRGATAFGVFWPTLLPWSALDQWVVFDRPGEGEQRVPVAPPPAAEAEPPARPAEDPPPAASVDGAPTVDVELGRIFGTRSGDKGGNANLGVWAPDDDAFRWLLGFLTVGRLQAMLPELATHPVVRHTLPGVLAVNFVISGLLGRGVASSTRFDPQAKSLGEALGSCRVPLPAPLVPPGRRLRTPLRGRGGGGLA